MKLRLILSLLILALAFSLMPASSTRADTCAADCPPPITPCDETPDPRTPGFWKNHPDAWVRCDQSGKTPLAFINLCCDEGEVCDPKPNCVLLRKDDAIAIMNQPVAQDKTYTMVPALIAAQLNRLAGADTSCVNGVIRDARIWTCANWGEVVLARSPEWQYAEALYEKLDYFNNYGCPLP